MIDTRAQIDRLGGDTTRQLPFVMTRTRERLPYARDWFGSRRRRGAARGGGATRGSDRPPPPLSLFRRALVNLTRGETADRHTNGRGFYDDMTDQIVTLTENGHGAQVYLPREVFRHSEADLDPGDRAVPVVLADGRIALEPVDEDAPVDGRRRETTGDDGSKSFPSTGDDGRRRETTGDPNGGIRE